MLFQKVARLRARAKEDGGPLLRPQDLMVFFSVGHCRQPHPKPREGPKQSCPEQEVLLRPRSFFFFFLLRALLSAFGVFHDHQSDCHGGLGGA